MDNNILIKALLSEFNSFDTPKQQIVLENLKKIKDGMTIEFEKILSRTIGENLNIGILETFAEYIFSKESVNVSFSSLNVLVKQFLNHS